MEKATEQKKQNRPEKKQERLLRGTARLIFSHYQSQNGLYYDARFTSNNAIATLGEYGKDIFIIEQIMLDVATSVHNHSAQDEAIKFIAQKTDFCRMNKTVNFVVSGNYVAVPNMFLEGRLENVQDMYQNCDIEPHNYSATVYMPNGQKLELPIFAKTAAVCAHKKSVVVATSALDIVIFDLSDLAAAWQKWRSFTPREDNPKSILGVSLYGNTLAVWERTGNLDIIGFYDLSDPNWLLRPYKPKSKISNRNELAMETIKMCNENEILITTPNSILRYNWRTDRTDTLVSYNEGAQILRMDVSEDGKKLAVVTVPYVNKITKGRSVVQVYAIE